jgi:hypothetical protein
VFLRLERRLKLNRAQLGNISSKLANVPTEILVALECEQPTFEGERPALGDVEKPSERRLA